MGSFPGSINTNFLPASTGLSLGNANQLWTAYLQNVFMTGPLNSNTIPGPALTGFINLASSDAIAWRNAANLADCLLAKTTVATGTIPVDALSYNGNGFIATFISPTANPAAGGALRLAGADTINFRNDANSGDIVGLSHNSDDTISVGNTAGAKAALMTVTGALTANAVSAASATLSGALNAASVVAPSISSPSSSALTIQAAPSQNVTVNGGNHGSGTGTGGSASLIGGDGGAGGGVGGNVTISVGSGPDGYGSISYLGQTLAGQGLAGCRAAIDQTAQSAAITTTTLYTTPNTGPGGVQNIQYFLTWNAKITTAATSSSTLGALTIVYTDPDGVAVTLTAAATIAAGTVATTSTANTTGTVLIGIPLTLNCKLNTNVTYAFAYASSGATAMQYNLHIRLEAL